MKESIVSGRPPKNIFNIKQSSIKKSPPPPPPPPPVEQLQPLPQLEQDRRDRDIEFLVGSLFNSFYPYLKKDERGEVKIIGNIEDESSSFIFEPPQGPIGATGGQGPKGDKGDQGQIGATGGQGPKGDKGDQGSKGDTGDSGANIFDVSKIMLNGDSSFKEEKYNGPQPVAAHSSLFS